MSTDSLAVLRRHSDRDDLAALAEQHALHDLTAADRDALAGAARRFGAFVTAGSVAGLGLGFLAASRARSARARWLAALRGQLQANAANNRPVEVRFADGRTEPISDLTQHLQPDPYTDALAALLFGAGGLFLGGEAGVLAGSWAAKRQVATLDEESRERIERGFRRFRADALRKEAERLDRSNGPGLLESAKSVVGWQ